MNIIETLAAEFRKYATTHPAEAEALAMEILEIADAASTKETKRSDTQFNTIIVKGKGPDGKFYEAEFEATFPKGTVITGVGHK